ncbi:MAG: stage II sporulation protein R [Brevibacillus sp.]|nr:stage II sporulation protein R [Brevibacillus sp.]
MKRFFFLVFALLTGMMSWENQLDAASVNDPGPIPQQSIRLRIIANSDSFYDQWLKREVRDAIVDQVNGWISEVGSIEDARSQLVERLPELQALVIRTIRERGYSYGADVQFGQVAFPTKLYGRYVYPAGEYEALLVKIGRAEGQNWWCVLFPPLCFIDMSNGEAVQRSSQSPDEQTVSRENADPAAGPDAAADSPAEETASQVEVRFFFWEKLVSLFS